MQYTYFVPRNRIKLTTRGSTSPDGVEMTLIRERKSTHCLGTRLGRQSDAYLVRYSRELSDLGVPGDLWVQC